MKLKLLLAKAAIYLLVLLGLGYLVSCSDSACIKGEGSIEQRELQLQPFSKIESEGDFKVYLTQGSPQKVEVKGEPNILSDLSTEVVDGKWKIRHRSCVRRSKAVEVYITVPEVSELSINGSGSISSTNSLEAGNLALSVNGSGKANIAAIAERIITRLSGSGEITLSGETNMNTIVLSGSGRIASYSLQADDVIVTLSGSGRADVTALNNLTVTISGSGSVYYDGSPSVSSEISGSGKVVRR
ncbi:head GIN domain-containing protein [Pontibacter sp. SGAir0037]|uniref:head GIN domain-containing protein n=1 Tax=Pontibacter sp. SGAir0037 TaxID=2571030 RepID=UPI0010CCD31C|nr:head GIN domain-containing protein [Pontibacter sp. SGAir0037]QCR21089.1 DUF2807 domain-containing protein [Pontibacter sp. SGAir0037]